MADKPQHWIEPNFTVEFAHDCTAVQVRASEGEWVSFLAAGSQKLIIFKDINANRVAAEMMGVEVYDESKQQQDEKEYEARELTAEEHQIFREHIADIREKLQHYQ